VGNKEGDATALKAKAEAAADVVNQAEADMQAAWADSTLQLAKIVIAVSSGGASTAGEVALEEVNKATAELTEDIKQNQGEAVDPTKVTTEIIGQMKEVSDEILERSQIEQSADQAPRLLGRQEAANTPAGHQSLDIPGERPRQGCRHRHPEPAGPAPR
jgi:hypothetical protein